MRRSPAAARAGARRRSWPPHRPIGRRSKRARVVTGIKWVTRPSGSRARALWAAESACHRAQPPARGRPGVPHPHPRVAGPAAPPCPAGNPGSPRTLPAGPAERDSGELRARLAPRSRPQLPPPGLVAAAVPLAPGPTRRPPRPPASSPCGRLRLRLPPSPRTGTLDRGDRRLPGRNDWEPPRPRQPAAPGAAGARPQPTPPNSPLQPRSSPSRPSPSSTGSGSTHAPPRPPARPPRVRPGAHPVGRTYRERARGGGQISFALSPSGLSSPQPVAASRVRDCAPSRRMRRGRGAPRPAGLGPRPSPRGRLPQRTRARMRFSPLGSPEPRGVALLPRIPGARGNPDFCGLASARSAAAEGSGDAPGSPVPRGPGGGAWRRVRPPAAIWVALGSPGAALPASGSRWPNRDLCPWKSKELS